MKPSFLGASVGAAACISLATAAAPAPNCCDNLEALGIGVLRPGSASFAARDSSYFSVSAQLSPNCIVQPKNTLQVSQAVKALGKSKCNLAVRGGGHMTWAGASNIRDGITLDLGLIKNTEYEAKGVVAKIGAGALWRDVYAALEPFGATAPGGRTSTVGVSGFLTGGGNNFYSSMVGLGADNVLNWEVVLADGSIVNANKDTNKELWKSLKGGSCNFGIVTRIDMQAIKTGHLWGGQVVYPLSTTERHIDAYVNWVKNIKSYPQGSAVTFWSYSPAAGGIVVATALHDTSGRERAPAYNELLAIPQLSNSLRHDSHLNMTIELEEPRGYRQIWVTLTGKNDARFIRRGVELQAQFLKEWARYSSGDPEYLNYITFQAMPMLLFKKSVEKGGNVLGMDREKDDAILFQMQHMVHTAEQEAEARKRLMVKLNEYKKYTVNEKVDVEWVYLGYADSWQDPIGSYGPENIKLIRQTAEKYDAKGFFQKQVPGGFKIGKAGRPAR